MTAQQLFEVLMRVLGIWVIVIGVERLPIWLDLFRHAQSDLPVVPQANGYLLSSTIGMVCGVVLFSLARPIAKWTFPGATAQLSPLSRESASVE